MAYLSADSPPDGRISKRPMGTGVGVFTLLWEVKMRKEKKIVAAQVDGETARALEAYARRRGHVKVNTSKVVRELLTLGLKAAEGGNADD